MGDSLGAPRFREYVLSNILTLELANYVTTIQWSLTYIWVRIKASKIVLIGYFGLH